MLAKANKAAMTGLLQKQTANKIDNLLFLGRNVATLWNSRPMRRDWPMGALARRKNMGLGTMAEYQAVFKDIYR